MRIVALADTHLFHEALDGKVPDGDVLVHAGDLLQYGTLDEMKRGVDFLRSFPHETKVLVAGNHDTCLQRKRDEARALLDGIIYLEDSSATIGGYHFYGSPWQPIFMVWAFGLRRGPELASKWKLIPDQVDVLVTHSPPHGYGDRVMYGDTEHRVGCRDLAKRVKEVAPRLHIFGHIHQDPGRWEDGPTTYANVTTAEGAHAAAVFDL
jgi:Icc-related predicted phosphoesterase